MGLQELTKGIPPDIEHETNYLKKGQHSGLHNIPGVEGQKTCANHKHDPCCNNNKHCKERQKNGPENKETLCCFPLQ